LEEGGPLIPGFAVPSPHGRGLLLTLFATLGRPYTPW